MMLACLPLLASCSSDERIVQVATEAADRQADQNQQMFELQQQVQHERQSLSDGWTDLNTQRRQLAETRRADGKRHRARQGFSVVLVAVLVLVLTWQLLQAKPSGTEVELDALELMLEEGRDFLPLRPANRSSITPPPQADLPPQQLSHAPTNENSTPEDP